MFRQRNKRRALERRIDSQELNRSIEYPHRLNFYSVPPLQEVTIEEFEQWAIDRLKVLVELESCSLRNKSMDETNRTMKPVLDKYLPLSLSVGDTNRKAAVLEKERRKDHYSHFILRLAFCRTPNLRQRFVQLETMLFELRYRIEDSTNLQVFIDSLDLTWEPVTEEEKEKFKTQLAAMQGQQQISTTGILNDGIFKVDFEQVADLVESRKVFIYCGKAYVSTSHQLRLVSSEFSSRLKRGLEMTARALPRLDEDDRLLPILSHLADGLPNAEFQSIVDIAGHDGEQITADMVDGLVNKHFPLCLQTMHRAIRADHHAKYQVRQQYGLFLKGIGLTVDESINFWRKSFDRKSDDEFKKNYVYNIRHHYGLVGGHINYKPSGCSEIIKSSNAGGASAGACHGCPYRSFSPQNLSAALQRLGITGKQELAEIEATVNKQKYHVACTKVYELTHPEDKRDLDTITHPNHYFELSYYA